MLCDRRYRLIPRSRLQPRRVESSAGYSRLRLRQCQPRRCQYLVFFDDRHVFFVLLLLFSFNQSILKPNAYIVTQGPNERTIDDFWRLIWQSNASCIVMLTKTFDFIKVHPSNRSLISSGVILPHPGLTFNELNHFSLDHLNQLV